VWLKASRESRGPCAFERRSIGSRLGIRSGAMAADGLRGKVFEWWNRPPRTPAMLPCGSMASCFKEPLGVGNGCAGFRRLRSALTGRCTGHRRSAESAETRLIAWMKKLDRMGSVHEGSRGSGRDMRRTLA